MPTFIMLSTLGPDGAHTLNEHPTRLKEVNAEVEALGVRIIGQYALLGPFDFLNILEAPDEQIMAKVAVMLGARGTLKTQTLTAIPIDDFVAALRDET